MKAATRCVSSHRPTHPSLHHAGHHVGLSAAHVSSRRKSVLSFLAATLVTLGVASPLLVTAQDATTRSLATGSNIPLAADAPDSYTVKRGDTLWDIAKVFLRDPWFWPEIWHINQQVKNPHLIFPGDVLVLTSVAGRPQVTVSERGPEGTAAATDTQVTRGGGQRMSPRVRSTPLSEAVNAIPYDAIASFISKPTLLTKDQAKGGPYLVGIRDKHAISAETNEVYARRIGEAAEGARYNIVHVDEKIKDPENGRVLGYRGIYAGAGTVTRSGDPAKLVLGTTVTEVLQGDRLFPEDLAIPLDFLPHPPKQEVQGSIAALSGVSMVGGTQTVAINRGTRAGLDAGTVLVVMQQGEVVRDRFSDGTARKGGFAKKVRLPSERIGVVMVFKAYEDMSYALVMEATHPVRIADRVVTP